MRIELQDIDFIAGSAEVIIVDGESLVELAVSFKSHIFYENTSFDHAFGTHQCGHWDIEISNLSYAVIDSDGDDVAIDTQEIAHVLYQDFMENFDGFNYENELRNVYCA